MNKEIRYTGITTTPSDYECPDGDLRGAYNLLNEDGAIRPIFPPTIVYSADELGDMRVLCYHANTAPLYKHIILLEETTEGDQTHRTLYYLDELATDNNGRVKILDDQNTPILNDEPITTIQPIGNTLVVCTPTRTLYYLWKEGATNNDDHYLPLGTMPELELRFTNVYNDQKEYTAADNDLGSSGIGDLDEGHHIMPVHDDKQENVTNVILAQANKAIAEATEENFFVMPYFVRYAFRLYDGTTTRASAPCLMLPTTLAPFLARYTHRNESPLHTAVMKCKRFKLGYFCDFDQLQALKRWSDIIVAVDIFVSEPIWNYDQSGKCKRVMLEDYYNYSLQVTNTDFLHYASAKVIPMVSDYLVSGTWQKFFELPQFDKSLEERAKDVQNFHLFKSIPLEELERSEPSTDDEERDAGSEQFYKPAIIDGHLSALSSREALPDDYDSHDTITAESSFTFNARLTLANISKHLFEGFSPLCCYNAVTNDFTKPTPENPRYFRVKAYTFIKTDEGEKAVCHDLTHEVDMQLNDAFPRWYYYPNNQAHRTIWVVLHDINYASGASGPLTIDVYDLQLRSHDFLNGAYYCALTKAEQPTKVYTTTESTAEAALAIYNDPKTNIPYIATALAAVPSVAVLQQPNKSYTSEVNNPFLFPLTGINTIGTGTILGLATATKALSEGQYGQFPLYAFTSDGVWALETSSEGAFIARTPVSRDICINPASITQTDNAVLFATDRGIMLLSGSQVVCISEQLEQAETSLAALPQMDKVATIYGSRINGIPFLEYIRIARIIYDYAQQRIYVYNHAQPYTYIFSLKSKQWGQTDARIMTHATAYPDNIIQAEDHSIVSLSGSVPSAAVSQQPTSTKCLLITRPLKLDGADILKTVNTVLQRGYFDIHAAQRRAVQQVIWGSRDLFRWDIVSSSTDWYMRGYRGTPYKYFVLAVILDLTPDERLIGATIQHEPRYINRPR